MRARRLTAAGMLTAAAFSTTVGGFAITGSLDKAFAASPVSPPVSQPQNPGQSGQGQNPGQSGQGQNQLNSEVSGPFSGTVSVSGGGGCSFVQQSFDASYTTSKGTGSLSMVGCVNFPSDPTSLSFSGSFTLTAPDGATLQGAAAGSEVSTASNPTSGSLSFTLSPTSGTNEFVSVTGVINLSGTIQAVGIGTISGSLSGALT